ncbi:lecithin retinol acyltransferase family protein [Paraburkholderia sp. BR10872]|uniref:lecithin retinol acyltransferase family protein n=1 Tax=Paraburkholderia sp. BR10872 TaxID=3236989 RepID=UPI0034D2749A
MTSIARISFSFKTDGHSLLPRGRSVDLYQGFGRGPVEVISLQLFSAGFGFEIVQHPHALYTGVEVARRAASRLGEQDYRLLTNNCEHLCMWCVAGHGKSDQVDACIRNPARAVRVLFTLFFCKLVRDCKPAAFGKTFEAVVPALNY